MPERDLWASGGPMVLDGDVLCGMGLMHSRGGWELGQLRERLRDGPGKLSKAHDGSRLVSLSKWALVDVFRADASDAALAPVSLSVSVGALGC